MWCKAEKLFTTGQHQAGRLQSIKALYICSAKYHNIHNKCDIEATLFFNYFQTLLRAARAIVVDMNELYYVIV